MLVYGLVFCTTTNEEESTMTDEKVPDTLSGAHPSFHVRRRVAEQRKNAGDDGILGVHPTATVSEDKRIEREIPVVEKKTMPSLVSWGDRAASLIAAVHA